MKSLSEKEFLDWADLYLQHELTAEDRLRFEHFCKEYPDFDRLFKQHVQFIGMLKQLDTRNGFKQRLKNTAVVYHNAHQEIGKSAKIISLWNKLKFNAAVAAAIAIISVFSTLWLTGYYSNLKKTTSDYSALRREMNNVKRNVNAQSAAIKNMNSTTVPIEPTHYGATGFMITKDGYVVTNYHVVHGADSVHLQNHKGQSFKADIIFKNAEKDLAILRINDTAFKSLKSIPYSFKKLDSDLGEDVYTIGFPRDEAVYGQGYLSSATGYSGDTLAYQISIPVNPGNSGGPVLDKEGNVIGIISGKQKGIDGAAFAIKTKALIETLNSIPTDSLQGDVVLNHRNTLSNLSRTDQIKKLQDYIYIVKVY